MKTLITPSMAGSRIQMPDDKRRRAETLGAFACQQLQNQDPSLWAKASDREFLRMIKQGAKILRKIGLYATLDLSEAEAQLALIACRFVALQPGLLSAKQRRIMQYLLLLLSRCCFISLDSRKPSELGNFGHRSRISPDLKRAYRDLLRGKPVSLSIATQLWSVRDRIEPRCNRFDQQLGEATLGFRSSLHQLCSFRTKKS